ncbi:MAG: tetratricopeptide repeat protein, partial [Planctomycetes bacterium]|nr:tetratricopeptide repeat protein [Planctomycetota bacterium]
RHDDPDPERAAGYLDRIAALPTRTVPDDDATAVRPETIARLRANIASLRGRYASAIGAAEERLKVAPGDAAAWAQLGEACRMSQRLDRAQEAYREALRRAPGNALYAKQLVLLLCEAPGNDAELDRLTASLLASAPESPEMLILRARALVRDRRTDRTADAIEIYRSLLRLRLTPAQEAEACRNLGVALYDWKQAGRPGDFLDEAHVLLKRYRDLGGEIDLRLEDVWERLEARATSRSNNGPPK